MRHKPALKYCGVTIELEFPGRFDKQQLIDGSSSYILREALDPLRLNRYAFDIRTRDCKEPYQEGTRVVLLCGDSQLEKLNHRRERINTLRGSPFKDDRTGIISIPTYHPQQATDRKNYELTHNPFAAASIGADGSDKEDEDDDESSAKDMGKTARRNFRFWFIQDLRKAVDISRRGLRQNVARYHTALRPDEILFHLRRAGSAGCETLYFDIECERTTGRIVCFAFSFNAKDIYVAPILDHTGQPMYGLSFAANVFRELAAAFSRCTVVAHNGPFDFFITLWRYHIPPPRQDFIYDTFIAQSRIHVDVEKSLGHCGSLWTHQSYHKDEGEVFYGTPEGYNRYLIYNAKDVELTALIHQEQLLALEKDPGLRDSVTQGCQLIRPLILKSYRGLRLNSDKLCKKIDELNTRATWIISKLLAPLAGGPINPRSSQKVGELLYTKFGLPKSTDPTISLTGKDALYKLALKFPIPILPLIHHSRRSLREAGHLSAKLWRDSHTTCSYVIPGTKTFRLSSRKLLGTFGTNLQNWSKKMRQLVVAGPGYKLVQVDQAGAEALIVAYLAPPGRYRDLFIHKVSPHVYFGLYAFPDVWKAELGYDIKYLYEASIEECKADKRWKEIAKCIKATDNNPPSRRYYYFQKQINHCLPAGYEVLTPTGWKKIESNPDRIAHYEQDSGRVYFNDVIQWNNSTYDGEMISFYGKEFEQTVTPNHKIPYCSNGDKISVESADYYSRNYKSSSLIVASVYYDGGKFHENLDLLSLVLALQADGHDSQLCNRWTFRFGKERKVKALRSILTTLGIPFSCDLDTDCYWKFTVVKDHRVYKYLTSDGNKEFKLSSFLELDTASLCHVCRDILYWDGQDLAGESGHQSVYRTRSEHNADVMYTLFKLCGHGSTKRLYQGIYSVSQNVRRKSRTEGVTQKQYKGTIHCPTVNGSLFLVRSPNGKISVTHNSSNYDITAPRFAMNLLEKSEGEVWLPVHECDRLLNIYHNLYPEIRAGFQSWVIKCIQTTRTLRNMFGYPRHFYGNVDDVTVRKDAFSWVPQSTVGVITGRADSSLQRRIDGGELDYLEVWQNNHDSLLARCRDEDVTQTARVMMEAMNQRMVSPRGEEFAMRSEASVGDNWYDMEPIEI